MTHRTAGPAFPALLLVLAFLVAALLAGAPPVRADEPGPEPEKVRWFRRLSDAYEAAKKEGKPLFIAINAEYVDGGRREPAAKELRENTYLAPAVVEKSKAFVPVYLTPEGSSDDYGELRLRYGIQGEIVSPQHIFAKPDGALLFREEYWIHGRGDGAVKALVNLMDRALRQWRTDASLPPSPEPEPAPDDAAPPPGPAAPDAPADEAARGAWIEEVIGIADGGDEDVRREALSRLIKADRQGDAANAVIAALARWQEAKRWDAVVDAVRALGRPDLVLAVPPLAALLDHKQDEVRANAAVSLEYIGSPDAVPELLKRAPREKDEGIANHLFRALGRCGAKSESDDKVRALLDKKATGAKSDFGSLGPLIALGYFEKDAKAARDLEKLAIKEGVGGGRRGRGGGAKRSLVLWALAQVGDEKSGPFIRDRLMPEVGNGPWAEAIRAFYEAGARVCEGDASAMGTVDAGVTRALEWSAGSYKLRDDARRGREDAGFTPKGEWEITPGAGGPGGGPPGGGRGGGPGGR
jgi:hypothetical protein